MRHRGNNVFARRAGKAPSGESSSGGASGSRQRAPAGYCKCLKQIVMVLDRAREIAGVMQLAWGSGREEHRLK